MLLDPIDSVVREGEVDVHLANDIVAATAVGHAAATSGYGSFGAFVRLSPDCPMLEHAAGLGVSPLASQPHGGGDVTGYATRSPPRVPHR